MCSYESEEYPGSLEIETKNNVNVVISCSCIFFWECLEMTGLKICLGTECQPQHTVRTLKQVESSIYEKSAEGKKKTALNFIPVFSFVCVYK